MMRCLTPMECSMTDSKSKLRRIKTMARRALMRSKKLIWLSKIMMMVFDKILWKMN